MAQGFLVLFGWGEETTRFHEKIVVHISDDVFLILVDVVSNLCALAFL